MRPVFDEDGGASLGLLAAAEKRYTTLKTRQIRGQKNLVKMHTTLFATQTSLLPRT